MFIETYIKRGIDHLSLKYFNEIIKHIKQHSHGAKLISAVIVTHTKYKITKNNIMSKALCKQMLQRKLRVFYQIHSIKVSGPWGKIERDYQSSTLQAVLDY